MALSEPSGAISSQRAALFLPIRYRKVDAFWQFWAELGMVRPFDPKTDTPKLRSALLELAKYEKLNPAALIRLVEKYRAEQADSKKHVVSDKGVITRTTLQNFLKDEADAGHPSQHRDIWNCLAGHPYYGRYLPEQPPNTELVPEPSPLSDNRPAEAVLSEALTLFLQREKPATLAQLTDISNRYPGEYVMYRADLRPYKLKMNIPPRFRASNLTIELVEKHLLVTEIQDYPKTETDEAFYFKTTGILFPYGKHYMFLAQAVVRESFRLGVIDREYSFTNKFKVGFFQGMILVASSEDLFPSTPFFCLRNDGTLETGLIPLERIRHGEARAYLQHAHEKAAFHYKQKDEPS